MPAETWLLALGVAIAVGACAVARSLLDEETWQQYGGFELLAATAILHSVSVALGTRRRP